MNQSHAHQQSASASASAISLPCLFSRKLTLRTLYTLLVACVLVACSSGGGDDIFVSTVTVAPASLGRSSVITVSGSGFVQGITVSPDTGCDDLKELAGGNNLTRQFSCTVSAIGELTIRVKSTIGREVASVRFIVPEPEVTLTVSGLGPTDQQIVLALDGTRAPISTRNFLAYVNSGFYDGIIFHRVDTSNGVVQAGGFVGGLQSKAAERAAIPLESANGLSNLRGTLGMARTSAPGSATSQFYFNVRDNLGFDYQSDAAPGFAVFGRVTDGLAVIDRMAEAQVATLPVIGSDGKPIVDSSGRPVSLSNVPVQDITIRSAIQTR